MLIESFVSNPGRLAKLRDSLEFLNEINFFGVMLDIASRRSAASMSTDPDSLVDVAAQRAAWHDGYTEALNDIFYFHNRFAAETVRQAPRQDYGAANSLYIKGDLTDEEYEQLTGKPYTSIK